MESQLGVFLSGGISGTLSWLVTYPIDTIKSRIQTNITFKDALNKGNIFNGLSICLVRTFLVNATGFYAANNLNKLLKPI